MKIDVQYTDTYQSPLGGITLSSDGECLTGLWFDGQKYFGSLLTGEEERKTLPVLELTKKMAGCLFQRQGA